MGLRDLLGQAVGFARGVFSVLGKVHVTEIGESLAAFARLRTAVEACEWSDREDVGGVIDASLVALKEAADVTTTQVDDQLAAAFSDLATAQRDFLIEAITFFAARPDATTADLQAAVADPSMPIGGQALSGNLQFWISVAFELWTLIRAARGK